MSERTLATREAVTTPAIGPQADGLLQRQCACGQHTIAGGECTHCRDNRHHAERSTNSADYRRPGFKQGAPPIERSESKRPEEPADSPSVQFVETNTVQDFSRLASHSSISSGEFRFATTARKLFETRHNEGFDRQRVVGTQVARRSESDALAPRLGTSRKEYSIHPKLVVGEPNNPPEHEADRVTDTIQSMREPVARTPPASGGLQQRLSGVRPEHTRNETAAPPNAPSLGAIGEAQATERLVSELDPGQPLDTRTRAFMERRLGRNFGDVRIHTDTKAAASAREILASAYTLGRDIVFGSRQYSPNTAEGRKLLAHELVHVIQQSSGQERAIAAKSSHRVKIGAPDDPLEAEAERVAETIESPSAFMLSGLRAPVVQQRATGDQSQGTVLAFVAKTTHADDIESALASASSGGQAMDVALRAYMEQQIGADFSQVRIHTDGASAAMNRDLNALAFSHGADIYFGPGKYDPSSLAGQRLLAHELAHVVQQGAGATGGLIQRKNGTTSEFITFTFHVPDSVRSEEELFRLFDMYVFGEDKQTAWHWEGSPPDLATIRGKQITLKVSRSSVESKTDPALKQQREQSKKTYAGFQGEQKQEITAEANKRYSERSGDRPGRQIKPDEEGKSRMWEQALADVLKDKATLEALPKAMKELLGPESSYRPVDYQHLLRIAEKLKLFTPEDLAAYKLLTIRATADLDLFEKSVDLFLARREELKKALDQQLQQRVGGKEKDIKETLDEKWKGLDEASIATMSESDRYALARRMTSELTEAQLRYMKEHPGQTAKDFAKSALLLNTGETFSAIGKDLQEAASGDANTWARWAAGTGAGAKLSGWLLALAGVIYVASWFTGIGELATIAAAAGVLLGATLTLSLAESELRIKAASQAKTPEEFKRNVELAAAARTNVIVGLALIVVAAVLHFTAKALFPETVKKISTSIKNFRERVRLKGSIYEIKPKITAEMGSLKTEVGKVAEAAKRKAIGAGDELSKLSTEQFVDKLETGGGSFLDQSKLPPEQKVNFRELLKTPEGRAAIEGYRTRLVNALKTEVPAEIDRLAEEYTSKIDDFLKDVDAAKNHDDLKVAADKIEGSLTEEHAKQFVQAEQEKITKQKLEEAAQEAHKEVIASIKDAIIKRIKARIASQPDFQLSYTDAELEAIINKGKELGLSDRMIEDFIYVGSRTGKPIIAADLIQQMNNWANIVSKRGFPFKFADLGAFQRFSADLIAEVQAARLPADDVRIQGSALRKPTANDVDIAIFLDQAIFDKLLIDRFSGRIRKNNVPISLTGKAHAELAQIVADIDGNPGTIYNNQAKGFARAFTNGIFNSHSDVLGSIKTVRDHIAGKYADLNIETVSVLSKGALFELQPDLPVSK